MAITDVPIEGEMRAAGLHEVVMDHFSFTPGSVSVPVGTTVMWTNRDDVPHNVVSTEQTFKSPACSEFCGSGPGQLKAALRSVAATPTAGS